MAEATVHASKAVGAEITRWENKLEEVKAQVEKQTQVRDALVAEIESKTNNFEIYMAGRTNEDKRVKAEIAASREQLVKDQSEFQAILLEYRNEKNAVESERKHLELEKVRHAGSVQNVQEFVTAIRRAVGLLGI